MRGFIVRLVGYALLLGGVSYVGQAWWTANGLDAFDALRPLHDAGLLALLIAPLVLALVGVGRLRAFAIFAGFYLAGAALTAPWICARVVGV
jgi:hypothetical protein